jgi:hypothetical protein
MKADEREEPFILLSDPPLPERAIQIQFKAARRVRPPSGDEVVFDPNYEPLLFSEREIRRRLLAPWRMISPAYLKEFVDPYVARELHRQETRDKELRDLFDALLGKASDWRTALCVESQRNIDARSELGRIQGNSWAEGNTDELGRFLEALKAVKRLNERGPVRPAKAWALSFVFGCRMMGEPLPYRGEVLEFLSKKGIKVPKNNAARDIFTGPILSALAQRPSGAPKTKRRRHKN